jgi:hypothetical protein
MSTDINIDDSRFVLSVDNNDLIIYATLDPDNEDDKIKYICKNCINSSSKLTKRLVYALKLKGNLSIRMKYDEDNDNIIILSVIHPLYDDDIYILKDESVIESEKSEKSEKSGTSKSSISEESIESEKKIKKKVLTYIYVLELAEQKYYVGKSSKPLSRTGEHLISMIHNDASCSGSGWTGLYEPIRILEVNKSYDEFDEDVYTLRYMKNHGIDNVRGGSFCELNLSHDNVMTLEKMLAGAGDKCYYCGSDDHYVASCPQKKIRRVAQKKKHLNLKAKDIPKSRMLKYIGTAKLMKNSDINLDKLKKDSDSEEIKYHCKYCNKGVESKEKLKTHENIMCTKSPIVAKGKMIEANVDAILAKNEKYIKNKL